MISMLKRIIHNEGRPFKEMKRTSEPDDRPVNSSISPELRTRLTSGQISQSELDILRRANTQDMSVSDDLDEIGV